MPVVGSGIPRVASSVVVAVEAPSVMTPEPAAPIYAYTSPVFVSDDGVAINCILTHPRLGAIPFTARSDDAATAPVHAQIVANAEVTPIASYVPPPSPPPVSGALPTKLA